jgi:hypothetical protein
MAPDNQQIMESEIIGDAIVFWPTLILPSMILSSIIGGGHLCGSPQGEGFRNLFLTWWC